MAEHPQVPAGSRRLIPLLAVAIAIAFSGCSGVPYPEFALRGLFRLHRSHFERIVQMSDSDYAKTRVTRIGNDFTRLENDWGWPRSESKWGITRSRWEEYRHEFAASGLPNGIDREQGEIRFMTWAIGFVGEGTEDGILWAPHPMKSTKSARQTFLVKPIEGNWYLYHWDIP
jgi:hypothetical protein